jgi:hypothetical protein
MRTVDLHLQKNSLLFGNSHCFLLIFLWTDPMTNVPNYFSDTLELVSQCSGQQIEQMSKKPFASLTTPLRATTWFSTIPIAVALPPHRSGSV